MVIKSNESAVMLRKVNKLTEKQDLFCKAMFTAGSQHFGNGTKAYRESYPMCKSDNAAGVQAKKLLSNAKIIARKIEIQAKVAEKLDHNRDKAIDTLYAIIKAMLPLAMQGNSTAAAQVTSATRELNAISNLHSHTVNSTEPAPEPLSAEDVAELKRIAKSATSLHISRTA
tara:strand:- start:25 stop:537 length:513 start_codon:yes stop_codon:yes gene_type:complete